MSASRQVIDMKKLSTNLTFFWRLYAIVWFLFFPVAGIYWLYRYFIFSEKVFDAGKLVLFILFALISSFFVHFMLGKLKNVFLDGNSLVVSNFFRQIRIPLSEVSHVDNPDLSSLRRIKIILHKPSEFGEEIVFAPPMFEAKETARILKSKIETNYLSL